MKRMTEEILKQKVISQFERVYKFVIIYYFAYGISILKHTYKVSL